MFKTSEELQSEISEILVAVYNSVDPMLCHVGDSLLHDAHELELLVENGRRIKNLRELKEQLVDDSMLAIDPMSMCNEAVTMIDKMTTDLTTLGKTPDLPSEHKKIILQMVMKYYDWQDRLGVIQKLVSPEFYEWSYEHVMLGPTHSLRFSILWNNYFSWATKKRGVNFNKRTFAQLLRELGARPVVRNIDGKATRMYDGIALV